MGKYELNCTDCPFNVEFDGSVDDVLDRIDEHQADMKSDPLVHFVNFDRVNGAERVCSRREQVFTSPTWYPILVRAHLLSDAERRRSTLLVLVGE